MNQPKSNLKWLLIVLAVVIIGGGLYCYFGIYKGNQTIVANSPTPTNSVTNTSNPSCGQITEMTNVEDGKYIQDTIQPVSLKKGCQLKVALSNPGDGGYIFNQPPIFNNSVLSLKDHQHIQPISNLLGDFGSDYWVFEAKSTGQSNLEIDISRPGDTSSQKKDFIALVTVN